MDLQWILYTILFLLFIMILLQTQRRPYDLPKIVWTHWDSDNPPEAVKKTVERMRLTGK